MNAKDLRDYVGAYLPNGTPTTIMPSEWQTILRALDLLVAVEESGDDLVRMCNDASHDERLADGMLYRKAAARIVAQDAVLRELKEERYAERDARRKEEARGDNLRRERDSLKRHAEAMHDKGKRIVNGHGQVAAIEAMESALSAYRRDHPKEEA